MDSAKSVRDQRIPNAQPVTRAQGAVSATRSVPQLAAQSKALTVHRPVHGEWRKSIDADGTVSDTE